MAADEIRGPERGTSNVYKLVPIFTAIDALPEFDLRATMRNRYGDFSILKINPITLSAYPHPAIRLLDYLKKLYRKRCEFKLH